MFFTTFRLVLPWAISCLMTLSGLSRLAFSLDGQPLDGQPSDIETIDYQVQIRPILVDHCLACHGLDQESRQGGLRLDLQGDALRGGESGKPAIVPGNPETSELIRRILANDSDELMPPKSHGSRLSCSRSGSRAGLSSLSTGRLSLHKRNPFRKLTHLLKLIRSMDLYTATFASWA